MFRSGFDRVWIGMTAHAGRGTQQAGFPAGVRRRWIRWAIWLSAAALVCATVFTLLARGWWPFDLSTHFRLHYVIAGLLVLIAAMMTRAFISGALVVGCIVIHGSWLVPLIVLQPPHIRTTDDAGPVVRVGTLNVSETNATTGRVLAVLDAFQPDILAMQETTPWWPEPPAALLSDYPYQAPLAWDLGRSVTLISRFPITAHQMWDGGGLRLQFPALTVDVNGRSLTVIAVHPPYALGSLYGGARLNYMANIAEAVRQSSYPVVVLGDFNSTPFSPIFADLIDQTGLRNAADGMGYFGTWPAILGPLGIPIDNVLVSPGIGVNGVMTGSDTGSDHLPLFVDLRLGASEDL